MHLSLAYCHASRRSQFFSLVEELLAFTLSNPSLHMLSRNVHLFTKHFNIKGCSHISPCMLDYSTFLHVVASCIMLMMPRVHLTSILHFLAATLNHLCCMLHII